METGEYEKISMHNIGKCKVLQLLNPSKLHIRGRSKKELKPGLCFQSFVQKVYNCFLQKDSQSPLLYDHFSGGVKDLPKLQCDTSKCRRSWLAEEHKPTEIIRKVNTAFAGNS